MGFFTYPDLRDATQSATGHIVQVQSVGKFKEVIKAVNGPVSYDTGGTIITAEELQLTWINHIHMGVSLQGDRIAHVIYPDNAGPSKTVKIMITSLAGVEVGAASDQSLKTFRLRAQGTY